MTSNYNVILTIFFILFSSQLKTQSYSHHQLTTEDGLPTNYVYGVIEDKEGYIWAYTEKGVSKFDGYEFKNYSIEDGLPVNDIYIMHESKDDVLWMFGIENSVAYIKNDSIFSIDLNTNSRGTMRMMGNSISYRTNDLIWTVENEELIKHNISDKYQKDYFNPPTKSRIELKSLTESFGFDFNKGLFREFSKNEIKSETSFSDKNPEYAPSSRIYYTQGNNPYYIICGKLGFLLIEEATKESTYTSWSSIFKNTITRWNVSYNNEEALISTNSGLVSISANRILTSYDFPKLGKEYSLRRSYKDSKNNVWVGTQEGGLFFFSSDQLQSKIIASDQANDNLFKHIVKNSTGKIFAISSKGTILDLNSNKVHKKLNYDFSVYDAKLASNDNLILTASNEPPKIICLGEKDCSKKSIDSRFWNFIPNSSSFSNPFGKLVNIKGIIINNDQDLIINHTMELYRLYILNDSVQYTRIDNRQRFIYQSPFSNTIYTADKENLYKLEDNNKLKKITSLPSISCLYPFGNSGLLIGTESSGLYEYQYTNNEIKKIGDYESITQIYNHQNIIYTSSNEGIFKLEKDGQSFKQTKFWGINQGLPSLEVFNFHIDEELLIACTNNGVAKIKLNPNPLAQKNTNNQLTIDEMKINDQQLNNGMKLRHSQNDLSIKFNLHDIKSFGKIKYKYKLNPIQKEWQTTSDREVVFNNLAPNKYSFDLIAYDNNNFEYQLEEEINFEIRKAFWQSLLFYFSILFLASLAYFAFDKRREEKLQQEVELEKEQNKKIANLKLEALRSQMNPHFVFNSLGAIQYYIQTHKIADADNYLTLFANLMRKYLNSSSEQLISLQDEVSLLKDYIKLEQMRFENMFESEILIDPNVDINAVMIPSMMVQPYVENAINHGLPHRKDGKALLQVSIKNKANNDISIEIRDNGIGIENAKKNKKRFHKSKAMKNTEERIKSFNKAELLSLDIDITNNSNDNEFPGTLVVINLKKQTQWNTPQLL